jgi:hypothetical protein
MSEGSDSAPQLKDLMLGTDTPVECEANLVSYFDPTFSVFWGMKLLLLLHGT